MARRIQLDRSTLRAKRRKRLLWRAGLLGIFVVLVVGGVIGATWLPQVRIHTIDIEGVHSFSMATVSAYAQTQLEGTYFFVIPKNSIFFYPKKEIEAALLGHFPQFKEATVRAENLETLSVVVLERGAVALWCDSASSGACYLLDAEGRAYGLAANFEGDAYRRYSGSLSRTTTPPQFLTPTGFRSLGALVDALSKVTPGNDITNVAADDNMDVHATFANGFVLLFALQDDPAVLLQRFQLALSAAPFTQHALTDFEYLDLRFGDKLYYKLKTQ